MEDAGLLEALRLVATPRSLTLTSLLFPDGHEVGSVYWKRGRELNRPRPPRRENFSHRPEAGIDVDTVLRFGLRERFPDDFTEEVVEV